MSTFLSELGGLTEGVGAEALAFAAGFAAARALEPAAVAISQDAFNQAPDKRLPPDIAAEAAAENYSSYDTMQQEAQYSGFDASRFAYLYDVTVTGPGMGELLNLIRRGTINEGNFTHGLRKQKLEPMWDAGLRDLANQKLSAADIAYMMVRGVLPDAGMLGQALPTSADNLTLPPQLPLDPVAEAALTGWDKERLQAFVGRSGLAMAPVMAAQARFRGILTANDYLLTIARGDLYPAYADPVLEVSRQILTADQWMEGVLRGWWDMQTGQNGAALHGMTAANATRLYQIRRRPMTVANITKALARGGTFDASQAPFSDPYRSSVHEADLGPEWYDLAESLKYTYPSAFVVRSLLTDGALTEAEGEQIFLDSGWVPSLAAKVAQHYSAGKGAAEDPHVVKAQTRLWSTMQTSYISGEAVAADLGPGFAALGVPTAAQTTITGLWDEARALERKQLTPTQLKKAVNGGVVNPATGAPWTHDEAVARMMSMGYSANDAATFLSL